MKLVLALAAAAGIYYFLGTEKGKEMVSQVKDGACDLTKNLFKKGKDLVSTAGDAIA